MMTSNVICLSSVREKRKIEKGDPDYLAKISMMERLELLEEMVQFQEDRAKNGQLSIQMMIRGQILFKALEKHAETEELRSLACSYQKHLKLELEAHLKNQYLRRRKAVSKINRNSYPTV